MKQLFVKLALITLLTTLAASQCSFNFQFAFPTLIFGECVESCSNPLYQNCPETLFIPWPMAQYCALTADNKWQNVTYTCQACGHNTNYQGYYFGECTCSKIQCFRGEKCVDGNCVPAPTCDTIRCQSGFQCVNDECVKIQVPPECTSNNNCSVGEVCDDQKCRAITCDDITCDDPLDTCQFGVCFRKYDYFCDLAMPRMQRVYCPIDRWYNDDDQQCQKHVVCGIATNGDLLTFESQCQACRRQFVGYFYNMSCTQVPKTCDEEHQTCVNGMCIVNDKCANIKCGWGKQCNNGICVQKNHTSTCDCSPNEECISGVCKPLDPCRNIHCPSDETCQSGYCIDKCSLILCPQGSMCQNGKCLYPIPDNGCPDAPCAYGYHCVGGHKCQKDDHNNGGNDNNNGGNDHNNGGNDHDDGTCSTNHDCHASAVCVGNYCSSLSCQYDWQCYGHKCKNGVCHNDNPKV